MHEEELSIHRRGTERKQEGYGEVRRIQEGVKRRGASEWTGRGVRRSRRRGQERRVKVTGRVRELGEGAQEAKRK